MRVVSIQFLVAWLSFNFLVYFMYKGEVIILIKVFGFIFDICIALLSTTTSTALYYNSKKFETAFKRCLHIRTQPHPEHVWESTANIVGFQGNQLKFGVREEGIRYFQQYQMAWS
ncbi:hypothetical protein KIN20_034362 [Parelaphostrongylus tenuis]|uniref:Uncharacterized protein n=1 Tax=Parelaphostrongylus tenuis TaxID=148309 RepID=A0AAD5RA20_PARTN|nr:hypothetical protein KIN20_034362 [Parelaphostrongylus tenuis]